MAVDVTRIWRKSALSEFPRILDQLESPQMQSALEGIWCDRVVNQGEPLPRDFSHLELIVVAAHYAAVIPMDEAKLEELVVKAVELIESGAEIDEGTAYEICVWAASPNASPVPYILTSACLEQDPDQIAAAALNILECHSLFRIEEEDMASA